MEKENALKILRELHDKVLFSERTALETFIPELKESEDEKIRKTLVELVKCNERCGYFMINNTTTSAMIAWLEKQGGQKPAWSEEDEEMCQETIDWFEKKCFPYALESENPARESIKWLKSIKQKIKGE